MQKKKLERLLTGPGWTEVLLAGALSAVLGALLGAVYLVAKPVAQVKERPAEPEAGTVYYVEGTRSAEGSRLWLRKRQLFVEGESVAVNESELNVWVREGTQGDGAPRGKDGAWLAVSDVNFHLAGDQLQIGLPGVLHIFGMEKKLVVQAKGGFQREAGGQFSFAPAEFYLGSLPVHKLPFLVPPLERRLLASQPVPEDVRNAWGRLKDVRVQQGQLWLVHGPAS